MRTYEIAVTNRSVKANSADPRLVRTSVGVDGIHVLFDSEEWLDFPVTVTFAQGTSDPVTQSMVLTAISNSAEWSAESNATIPWEVIDETGPIRVTFQGTDSEGRHIITAAGSPLTVVESGDVEGDPSAGAPTVDEWQRMRAEAMAAVNQAASLVATLQEQLDAIVAQAQGEIDGLSPATRERLGGIIVGDGLAVESDGTLSAVAGDSYVVDNLVALASQVFGADATDEGFSTDVKARPSALPVATLEEAGTVIPDGITVSVDEDGMLSCEAAPQATTARLGSVKPDGTSITIDADGTIHGADSTPIATTSTPGKVKPDGTSITIDQYGTIHGADTVPIATTSTAGKVRPDGTTITVDSNGTIHGANTTPVATLSTAGKVKPDGTSITIDSDGTIHGRGSADWNASSGEDGYIRNRPFYTTVTQVVDCTLPYVARLGNAGWYTQGQARATNPLVVGKTYFVTISSGWYAGAYEIKCTLSAGNPTLRAKVGAFGLEIAQTTSGGTSTLSFSFQSADSVIGTSEFFYDEKRVRIWSEDVTKLPAKYLPIDGTSITADDDGIVHSMPSVDNDTLLYAGGVLKANVMGDITDITPFGDLIPDGDEVGY